MKDGIVCSREVSGIKKITDSAPSLFNWRLEIDTVPYTNIVNYEDFKKFKLPSAVTAMTINYQGSSYSVVRQAQRSQA